MTLVLAAANSAQVVMLADRRLTSAGTVAEEDAGKLSGLVLGGARFGVGFSGLARAPGFDMPQWLQRALYDSVEPELVNPFPTFSRFAERASRDFAELPALRALSPSERRAEFLFVGYLNSPEHSILTAARVSNCTDYFKHIATLTSWEKFALNAMHETLPGTKVLVESIGASRAIAGRNADALHALLLQSKPHQAIIGKAIEVMREAAGHPAAAGTVGTRIGWLRIPSDSRESPESGYEPGTPTFASYMPDLVVRTPGCSNLVMNICMEVVGAERQLAVFPKVSRGARCPCKSGKRYKHCHGRRRRGRTRRGPNPEPSAAKTEGNNSKPSE